MSGWWRISLIVLVVGFHQNLFAEKDYNGRGFKAYQAGDYKTAHALFEKAIKADPRNPFAWLNRARTTVALAAGKEPAEYCEYESNWKFLALANLTKAVELAAEQVLPKIKSSTEKHFKKFQKSGEYAKWWASTRALPKTDGETAAFFDRHPDWLIEGPGRIPHFVTFGKSGKLEIRDATNSGEDWLWTVKAGKLVITKDSVGRTFGLQTKKFYFSEGQKSIGALYLVEDGGRGEQWSMGPLGGDCN